MIKKTLIAMGALLFSLHCFADDATQTTSESPATTAAPAAADIVAGKQYVVLPSVQSPDKEVIEFFSFNCPSCYLFENEFHGPQTIEKGLPEGVKFKRYHLDDFGFLGKELSEAWAIANVLGIQDKASQALYVAIQKEHTIKTADDIKALFATLGVDAETYDKTKDNFLVAAFLAQQTSAINELKPRAIPAVVVNRKYYIIARGLDQTSNESVINDYARVAAFLSELKADGTSTPAQDN